MNILSESYGHLESGSSKRLNFYMQIGMSVLLSPKIKRAYEQSKKMWTFSINIDQMSKSKTYTVK